MFYRTKVAIGFKVEKEAIVLSIYCFGVVDFALIPVVLTVLFFQLYFRKIGGLSNWFSIPLAPQNLLSRTRREKHHFLCRL